MCHYDLNWGVGGYGGDGGVDRVGGRVGGDGEGSGVGGGLCGGIAVVFVADVVVDVVVDDANGGGSNDVNGGGGGNVNGNLGGRSNLLLFFFTIIFVADYSVYSFLFLLYIYCLTQICKQKKVNISV